MPGTFSKASRPRRPGAYLNFEVADQLPVPPIAQGSVVAVPITHSWGPLRQAVTLTGYDQFRAIFGDYDSPGRRAVYDAFRGEGLPGRGGAGQVVAYRIAGASAASATRILANTGAANALTLTAKYEGAKGNDLRVTVQNSAADSTRDELILYDGTVELERYSYPDTDITALVAQINELSSWVTATEQATGVALATVTSVALTAGNDGGAATGADWTALTAALAVERFALLAPYDLTDSAIIASLVAWTKAENLVGRRHMLVLGGALNETITDAITRAQGINDPNIVTIGGGAVEDATLGTLSTAQLVPRLAGILAQRGEGKSATFARFAGLTRVIGGATTSQIERAFDAGVIVLSRDTVAAAPVRIEKALTTYTGGDPDRPVRVFSNPKFVRTMHGIENEFGEFGESPGIIGELPVNDSTRNFLLGELSARMRARELTGVVQAGWTVDVDQVPPPSDDDEFVAFRIGVRFSRSTEQIYLTVAAG